jgi:acetyl esterase/lipase
MRRVNLGLLVVMSLGVFSVHGQETPEIPERDAPEGMLAQAIVYSVEGMDDVGVERNIVYKVVEDEALLFDVYTPADADPDAVYPVVIFGAGSPPPAPEPLPKDWAVYQSWGRLVAASGLIAVIGSHREIADDTGIPMGIEDMRDMTAFVRDHAAEYQIDPERICLIAFSAQVATGITHALMEPAPYFRCIVVYYGVMDEPVVPDMYSPLYYLRSNSAVEIPPILLAKAGNDMAFINSTIDRAVETARLRNLDLTLLEHPTGDHAFDLFNDDDTSREIIAETVAFLQAHLLEDME